MSAPKSKRTRVDTSTVDDIEQWLNDLEERLQHVEQTVEGEVEPALSDLASRLDALEDESDG